jgi:hypothetical protein
MTMVVWRGYCGTGGKPAGNREDKLDPNQSEKSIYSTSCTFKTYRYLVLNVVSGRTLSLSDYLY